MRSTSKRQFKRWVSKIMMKLSECSTFSSRRLRILASSQLSKTWSTRELMPKKEEKHFTPVMISWLVKKEASFPVVRNNALLSLEPSSASLESFS